MKKILNYILIITVILSLTGCSSNSTSFSSQPKEVSAYDLVMKDKDGKIIISGLHGNVNFSSYEILYGELGKTIPYNKRKKLYEKLGIELNFYEDSTFEDFEMDGTPIYSLGTILDVKATPEDFNIGDTVTIEVKINEYILKTYYDTNITLKEVEEMLGVKFVPYTYTITE